MAVAAEKLLTLGRVSFTPLQLENIHTHFRWNNDPELNDLDSDQPYEREPFGAFKKRLEMMIYRPNPNSRDFEIHAEGQLIGLAYLDSISWHNRHARVGITIGDRSYWGKGYGREALQLMLDYAFNELGLHRVTAQTFSYNTAWRKLAEWAGFQHEGTDRDYIWRGEQFWDKENYALLEDEYRAWLNR